MRVVSFILKRASLLLVDGCSSGIMHELLFGDRMVRVAGIQFATLKEISSLACGD